MFNCYWCERKVPQETIQELDEVVEKDENFFCCSDCAEQYLIAMGICPADVSMTAGYDPSFEL